MATLPAEVPRRRRASNIIVRSLRKLALGGALTAGIHFSIPNLITTFIVSNEATIANLTGSLTIIIAAGIVGTVLTELLKLIKSDIGLADLGINEEPKVKNGDDIK